MGTRSNVDRLDAGERGAGALPSSITTEHVRAPARFGEIEELQERVWGMDTRGIVPATVNMEHFSRKLRG
jgi:hypothetical protein